LVRRRFDVDDKIPEDALEQERVRRAERKAPNERGMDFLEDSMGKAPGLNDLLRRGGGLGPRGRDFGGSGGMGGRDFGRPSPMGDRDFGRGRPDFMGRSPMGMGGRDGMGGHSFGAGGISNMNRPDMSQQQQPQGHKSKSEQLIDKSLDLGAKGGKKAFEVLKELYPLMKTMGQNSKLRKSFLATLSVLYGGFGVLGLVFVLLGWNAGGFFLTMLFCSSFSFLTWIVDNILSPREVEEVKEEPIVESPIEDFSSVREEDFSEPEYISPSSRFGGSGGGTLDLDDEDEDEEDILDFDEEDDVDSVLDLDFDEDDDDEEDEDEDLGLGDLLAKVSSPEMTHGFMDNEESVEASAEKINGVTEKFEVIDGTLVNRGLLFDSFIDMLDGGTAAFDKEVVHDVDSEIALKYSTLLHEAQDAAGQKEDNYVEIQSFKERLMVFDLVVSRKNLSKANIDVFNEELTALISTKDDGSKNKGIYSKMVLSGRKIFITIFKGENHLVYLRDILVKNRDFFTNPKHKIPVCLGYDEKGSAVLTDLYDVESIICCGKPRTGKSVSVKVIVSQMVQFCSPKEVQFYMGDVKEGTSDWAPLQVPHVKRFESTPEGLLNILEYIIEVEAPRRSEIIGNAGSIKAYNKVNSDNKLPFIYIVFDELVALSSASEDAIRKDFHKALKRAITQFPNLGIRLILIPHTIRHDIIDKLASDNIDFKMAVKADNDTVKEVFKLKNTKDFQYSLEQIGEFAVKLPNSTDVKYAHAPVLMSDDLRIPMLFDTQRKIWSSVCPEEVETSAFNKGVEKKRQQGVLERTNLTDGVFEEPDWISEIAGRR
jgi:S-DNA-T family DNA segregation ATPase FtsK/SpoIIIE